MNHTTFMDRDARVSAYASVGTHLALLNDRQLAEAVAAAPVLGSGVGGRRTELEVAGRPVFVKRVPLTDLELRPEYLRSTANLFELPVFYQYGVGSAGFGAWRELAAHLMTTAWVLADEHPNFPLLYHWRVLPDHPPTDFADQFGGIDGTVAHWEGSAAVRRRLEAIGSSSASLVLFLEHIPQTLADWLPQADSPFEWLEQQLVGTTEFMSSRGFVHFDAHFRNLLTDGHRVYFADFGLALSRKFELSPEEADFLAAHLSYDRSYTPAHLLRFHAPAPISGDRDHHGPFLKAWLAGDRPAAVPPDLTGLLDRHAPHAAVLDEFFSSLLNTSKRTPYPATEIQRALSGA
jgi:hypothetical protein